MGTRSFAVMRHSVRFRPGAPERRAGTCRPVIELKRVRDEFRGKVDLATPNR